MCVTYFNFTNQLKSNTYYGLANDDGTITQKADIGYRFDPQGKISVGKDYYTITTNSNATEGKGFGCCDKLSLLTLNKGTGNFNVASVDSKSSFGPGSKLCGKFGCGIMQFSGIDEEAMTTVVWMDSLFPQPPPNALPQSLINREPVESQPNPDHEGLTFGNFNLKTGEITPLRPFTVDLDNRTATNPMDSGMVSYDATNNNFWFACNPNGDFNAEGACYVSTKDSKSELTVLEWNTKTYTITSFDYSKALKGAVVLGQTHSSDGKSKESTKLFLATEASKKNWDTILDLGTAWSGLHQATISPCGRYYFVQLAVGTKNKVYPSQDLLTIDLVQKKIIKRVSALHTETDITVLNVMPC
jgi:hypothetical protein